MFNWFNSVFNLLGFLNRFSVRGKQRKTTEQHLYLGIALCGCLGMVLIFISRNYLSDKIPAPDAVVYFTVPVKEASVVHIKSSGQGGGSNFLISEQVISGQMAIRIENTGIEDHIRVVINKGDYSGIIAADTKTRMFTPVNEMISISFSLVYECAGNLSGRNQCSLHDSRIDYSFFNAMGMIDLMPEIEKEIKESIHRNLDREVSNRIQRLINRQSQPGIVLVDRTN